VFAREFQAQQVASVFSRSNGILFTMQGGDLVSRDGGADGPGQWRWLKPAGRTTGDSYHEDQRGNLWFNTRDGAVGQLKGTNSEILSGDSGLDGQRVNYLTADPAGKIWVATDNGIAAWDGERFQNQTPTNGETTLQVSFLFCTKDGGCWVVANNRVRKCVNRQWIAEAESWGQMFGSHTPALGAHEDRQGGVWFRHFGQGVFHAKPDGAMRRISSADGLPGDRITCWFQDHEGNVWVGVDRGGLVRLREKRFQVIGLAEGLAAQGAVSVCEDSRGAIWIGTYGGGLNRWKDGRLSSFTLPEGPTRGFIFSAYPDANDRLWLSAGREDFYVYESGKISESPWTVHGVKAMLVDRAGRIWIGKKDGLACVSNGVMQNIAASAGVEVADIHALAEDKQGDIWAGGGNGALYHFSDGKLTTHEARDKLAQQTIWSLLPDDDGTIWIGTFRGGLLRFKDGVFTRYTMEDGLPSDIICQILDDGAGKLWIGSHKGIFQVAKAALHAFARGERSSVPCLAYGLYDGLPTLECSGSYQPSAWRSRDGRLWFTTFKGVVSIRPDDVPENRLPPPVVIEEMRVDGHRVEDRRWRMEDGTRRSPSSVLHSPSSIKIRPGKHYFEFRYTALSYVAPDKVRFRHKLDGLENEWAEAGNRREAHYSHLSPGKYSFRVAACNSDGVWNEQGAALAFSVLPHFWETWWFNGLVGVAVIGTIFGSVRFVATRNLRKKLERLKQQRAIERDRERIAKDIHDDLGAGLTQIMLQSTLAQRDSAEQTPTHLAQIGETARELVGSMDEIVWAINPENDTLDGLVTYIGKFVQEFAAAAGLRCRLDLPALPPPLPVAAEVRHNLFLAVKETLNNVAKHAQASEIFFQLRMQPSAFSLVLRDNGRGLDQRAGGSGPADSHRLSSGHGLRNLAKRLEQMGGHSTIKSVPNVGTEIELTVMLQEQLTS